MDAPIFDFLWKLTERKVKKKKKRKEKN